MLSRTFSSTSSRSSSSNSSVGILGLAAFFLGEVECYSLLYCLLSLEWACIAVVVQKLFHQAKHVVGTLMALTHCNPLSLDLGVIERADREATFTTSRTAW